jgi:hypothetical protein
MPKVGRSHFQHRNSSSESTIRSDSIPKGRRSRRRFSTCIAHGLTPAIATTIATSAPVANAAELFKTINITDDWRHNDRERGMVNEHRRSVARGEELFNNTKINITGVAGLNDNLNIGDDSGLLRHLPRLAEYRTPFGQGAT